MDKIKLNRIIEDLRKVIVEAKLEEIYDKDLLDFALRILISENISAERKQYPKIENKDNQASSQNNKNPNEASIKQKNFLKELEYEGEVENLSKLEADALIKEYLAKQGTKKKNKENEDEEY
jgi:hypothetical protein